MPIKHNSHFRRDTMLYKYGRNHYTKGRYRSVTRPNYRHYAPHQSMAVRKIQTAWRKRRYHSQYKRPAQRMIYSKNRNYGNGNFGMNISNQHLTRSQQHLLGNLTKAGIAEKKIKYFRGFVANAQQIAQGNSKLATCGGVCFNLNDQIGVGDNTPANGFSSTVALDTFLLTRMPGTGSSAPENQNTLVGKSMFCKKLRFNIDIQTIPNVTATSPANLADAGSAFLVPWVYRVLVVRKRPLKENNSSGVETAPAFSKDLYLSWTGAQNPLGMVTASPQCGEAAVNPKDVCWRKINFQNYQVLQDFKFKMACPNILGATTQAQNVGFKRLHFEVPINQKLDYDMRGAPGSATHPVNANIDYSILITSACPGVPFSNMSTSSPTDLSIQPSTANKWSATIAGHMVFVDC